MKDDSLRKRLLRAALVFTLKSYYHEVTMFHQRREMEETIEKQNRKYEIDSIS